MSKYPGANDRDPYRDLCGHLIMKSSQAGAQEPRNGTTWRAWHRIYSRPVVKRTQVGRAKRAPESEREIPASK
jgi:hypothetical protein